MNSAPRGLVICWITAPTMKVAESISKSLVSAHLVACVNIIPKVRSVYTWNGELKNDEEVLMMAKTKSSLMKHIEEVIRKEHPYDVPELISTKIDDGLPSFMKWAEMSCHE